MDFNEGYKAFISYAKTERLAVKEAERQLKAKGFKNIDDVKSLKAGDKVYAINKKKNVAAFIIGKEPLENGLRILGAHIDSPRMDLKEHPFYEMKGFALGDTHYYGGIKKYQWVTIPLALIGVVCKKDGSVVEDQPADQTQVVLNLHNIHKWSDTETSHKQSFKPFSYDSQANLFISSIRQNGGTYTYYDKEDRHGYIGFNSEETINAMNTLNTYYKNHTFGIPADWDEAKYGSNPFKAQKTLMTLGSSAGVTNDAPTGNAFDIKAAPVPYFNADKKFVISQGANLALMDKGSREQRLASWLLVKFLTKYANGYLCAATGYYPASPYAENGGMWEGASEDYVDYATFVEETETNPFASASEIIKAQTAKINTDYYVKEGEGWTKFVDQPFPGSASIRTQVANIPKFIFIDKMTPQAAINAVLERLQDYIKN